jgi:hypothetical protein
MACEPSARRPSALVSVLVVALWLTGAGAANAILLGSVDGAQFIPFGGLTPELRNILTKDFDEDPIFDPNFVPRYQQVWDSNAFTGTMNITKIEFFDFVPPPGDVGSSLLGGLFTLRLSTSTKAVDNLACCNATAFDSNMGGDAAVFALNVALDTNVFKATNKLTFTGTPFSYVPSLNLPLLLDVQVGGYDVNNAVAELEPGTTTFFQQTSDTIGEGDPLTSFVSNFDGGDNAGVRPVVNLVPEPSTFFLVGGGLLALLRLARQRHGTHR